MRWKVGLATGAAAPAPRVTPLTKVVFPAPSSPVSRTTSPVTRRLPRCSPTVSVSAAELVTMSGKVVVAGLLELHRLAARAQHLHGFVVGEEAERPQTRLPHQRFRSGPDQRRFLAARQSLLPGGSPGPAHLLRPADAASAPK